MGTTLLLGPNGSGKTTFIRALATVDRRASDNILFDGQKIGGNVLRNLRRSLGWLPQSFDPPKSMRLRELVEYVAWLKEVDNVSRRSASLRALDLTGLGDLADERVGNLSGGMVRRLGIAQAIVNQPSVVLLDEPTVSLDPDQRAEFCAVVRDVVAPRAAVIASTHLLEDVIGFRGNVLVLADGKPAFAGSFEQFGGSSDPTLAELAAAYESRARVSVEP